MLVGDVFAKDMSLTVLVGGKKEERTTKRIFEGRKVAICGVPGAFTPNCDMQFPEYLEKLDQFQAKGVDVACLAVNDPFVMAAWAKSFDASEKVEMLADGDASVVTALGISMDTGKFGGIRSRRFSALVDNGVVKHFNLEQGGAFTEISKAATLLKQLESS